MGALLHAGRNSSSFSSLAQEDAPHPHVVGLGESALSGRVQPPGEPVKVGRTCGDHGRLTGFSWATRSHLIRLRSRRERPTFHGLGENGGSALPLPPTTDNRQPTSHHLPFKNQNSPFINRQFFLCHAVSGVGSRIETFCSARRGRHSGQASCFNVAAFDELRALGGLNNLIHDPPVWQREMREDSPLLGREPSPTAPASPCPSHFTGIEGSLNRSRLTG